MEWEKLVPSGEVGMPQDLPEGMVFVDSAGDLMMRTDKGFVCLSGDNPGETFPEDIYGTSTFTDVNAWKVVRR